MEMHNGMNHLLPPAHGRQVHQLNSLIKPSVNAFGENLAAKKVG